MPLPVGTSTQCQVASQSGGAGHTFCRRWNKMPREPMPIARGWFQGALLTYLVGFTVLGVLAYLVYRDQPPLPTQVIASEEILFTSDDVLGGMHVFQRYGLMEYGSVYGHGAYLGPDFTAEYLNKTSELLCIAYQ